MSPDAPGPEEPDDRSTWRGFLGCVGAVVIVALLAAAVLWLLD